MFICPSKHLASYNMMLPLLLFTSSLLSILVTSNNAFGNQIHGCNCHHHDHEQLDGRLMQHGANNNKKQLNLRNLQSKKYLKFHTTKARIMDCTPYNLVSVEWYGAMGDGVTDDTQAFADAWEDACSLDSATLMVPEGFTYLVRAIEFKGPCGLGLTLELGGTLMAPNDPGTWDMNSSDSWLLFSGVNNLVIEGGGIIDGQGHMWWNQSCKINKNNTCQDAPTALKFNACENIKLLNIQIQNSQQIHTSFQRCKQVYVSDVQVTAPEWSPNTDGIHISRTKNVVIQSSTIGTGDDCISIVTESSNIQIQNLTCGPGHGISIGSLGKGGSQEYVSHVLVDGATLQGTTNGIRIKTWQGGIGYALGFQFQNIKMVDVSYPIIIDQYYCDSKNKCPTNEVSGIQVSEVIFNNISGTSRTLEAVKLQCSSSTPCQNIILHDINLTLTSRSGNANSTCQSAEGIGFGTLIPPSCLKPLVASYNNSYQHPQQSLHYDEM